MVKTATITLPHNFKPRKYQLPILEALDSGIKRAVSVWHRRSGKDKVDWNYMIKRAMVERGNYFYFLPTYTQAKKVIWDNIDIEGFKMLDHVPPEIIKSKNATELKIELKNGSIMQLIGADTFEKTSVGTNPRGIVFSEYSINDPNVWEYVRPILAVNKEAWVIFNFTPRGKNHGWKLLQIAKNNSQDWFWEILTVDDTGVLSREDIDKERREGMPEAMIQQEFYCKFLEGANQFFTRIRDNLHDGFDGAEPEHLYRIGCDLAKYQDWTVITPLDLNTFKVGNQERFNQIDWNLQKAKIEAFVRKYNNGQLTIDSTGVGDPIVEDLERAGLTINPYKFSETSRRQLLDNLSLNLAQDRLKLPKDEGLLDELENFQFVLGDSGKIKVEVPEGLTDDRVMSLALAVWDARITKPITQEVGIYKQDFN
jgi:hypothetical protein